MTSLVRLTVLGLAIAGLAFFALPAAAGPGTSVCTGALSGAIDSNLYVPAGQTCELGFATVAGNVVVAGHLFAYGYTFQGNVNVNGGTIALANGGHISGNLTITGSAGSNVLAGPNPGSFHTIGGNLTYTNNSGTGDGFVVNGAVVGGNITASFNVGLYWIILGNTTAAGNVAVNYNSLAGLIRVEWVNAGKNLECLGNVPAPTGSNNTVGGLKLGQCASL